MTERSLTDQALDLFVYAPIGLAFEACDVLPRLIERGRSQAGVARMVGEVAVGIGRRRFGEAWSELANQFLSTWTRPAGDQSTAEGAAAGEPAAETSASETSADAATAAPPPASAAAPATSSADVPSAADLAIPDYDSLSASQVVPRLAALSAEELDAVARYETAHRGRRTILGRVEQLRASRSS